MDTIVCIWEQKISIPLKPGAVKEGYTYRWNDLSADSIHEVFSAGTYYVTYNNGCHFIVDTFKLVDAGFIPPVITINVHELGTATPYKTYQWLLNGQLIPGAENRHYTVLENGYYQVIVSNDYGCKDTSGVYKVSNVTGIENPSEWLHQIGIYPNPIEDVIYVHAAVPINLSLSSIEGKVIKRATSACQLNVQDLLEGIYFLHITDQQGQLLKVEKLLKLR